MTRTYRVNEVFYSPQGEGVRAGTMNVFIRFSGCNMRCSQEAGPKSPGGFDCDTEFESGRSITLEELATWCREACPQAGLELPTGDGKLRSTPVWETPWLILTGGEPGLQVDREFCDYWHGRGVKLAIETNGSIELPDCIDWITVSPKVAEHAIRQKVAHEVKYVRGYGQGIPKTIVEAEYYLISPAFDGLQVHPDVMAWCLELVRENPKWRLSCQQHKLWGVR